MLCDARMYKLRLLNVLNLIDFVAGSFGSRLYRIRSRSLVYSGLYLPLPLTGWTNRQNQLKLVIAINSTYRFLDSITK